MVGRQGPDLRPMALVSESSNISSLYILLKSTNSMEFFHGLEALPASRGFGWKVFTALMELTTVRLHCRLLQ